MPNIKSIPKLLLRDIPLGCIFFSLLASCGGGSGSASNANNVTQVDHLFHYTGNDSTTTNAAMANTAQVGDVIIVLVGYNGGNKSDPLVPVQATVSMTGATAGAGFQLVDFGYDSNNDSTQTTFVGVVTAAGIPHIFASICTSCAANTDIGFIAYTIRGLTGEVNAHGINVDGSSVPIPVTLTLTKPSIVLLFSAIEQVPDYFVSFTPSSIVNQDPPNQHYDYSGWGNGYTAGTYTFYDNLTGVVYGPTFSAMALVIK